MRLVRDLVLIAPKSQPDRVGSLVLPETVERPEFAGVVRAVGPRVTDLAVDDVVLFGLWAGQERTIGDERCLVMRESDVLAVLYE